MSPKPQPTTNLETSTQPTPTPTLNFNPSMFLTAYGPKIRSQVAFPEIGLAKQSFKDECDINTIMRRYAQTGLVDHLNTRQPRYMEVPDGLDFASCMAVVVDARERFQLLPADVRDRFGNDPGKLLAFLQDEDNRAEAEKLGLVPKKSAAPTPPEPPAKASAAPPPVSPTGTPPATPPSAS